MMPPKRRTRKYAAKGRGKGRIQEAARSSSPPLLAPSDDEGENEALVATEESSLSEKLQEMGRQVIEQRENRLQKKPKSPVGSQAQVLEWVEEHPCLWNLQKQGDEGSSLG